MKIDEIEGIGAGYAAKLKTAGVDTTDELLEWGAKPAGRKALADSTGIDGDAHPRVGQPRRT